MEQTQRPPDVQKSILVVEDDPAVLNLVFRVLTASNYNVLTAVSGEQALQRSRDYQSEIHLLLSDFQMPGMSGIELATILSRERRGIGVLMMSGCERGMLVLNEGWHFLAKPFTPSQLRALIAGLPAMREPDVISQPSGP